MSDDRTSVAVTVGEERVLPIFEDKLMGIPVVLLNSAIEADVEGETGVIVPDPEELRAAVAVARVMIPHKLGGSEIRAVRKAMGMQAKSLADFLDVTPETFSRWENGKELISKNAERILRLKVFHTLRNHAPWARIRSEDILDIDIPPFRVVGDAFALTFQRVPLENSWIWWFCGHKENKQINGKVA